MNKEHKEECKKLEERSYEPNDESLRAIRETDALLTSTSENPSLFASRSLISPQQSSGAPWRTSIYPF